MRAFFVYTMIIFNYKSKDVFIQQTIQLNNIYLTFLVTSKLNYF